MCNRFRPPNELRQLPRDLQNKVVLPLSNVAEMFPGYYGPVIGRTHDGGFSAATMRWGFPTYAQGKRDSSKIITTWWTNARTLSASLWRGVADMADQRCLIPAVEFAEPDPSRGKGGNAWFAMVDGEGFCFAGLWKQTEREGPVFAFLTCEPNGLVGLIHPKAMPVILQPNNYAGWLAGEPARDFQKPFPVEMMTIVN